MSEELRNEEELQYQIAAPYHLADHYGAVVGWYETIDEALASPECMTGLKIVGQDEKIWSIYDYEKEFYAHWIGGPGYKKSSGKWFKDHGPVTMYNREEV